MVHHHRRDELVNFREMFSLSHFFYKTIGILPLFHDATTSWLWSLFFWFSFINLTLSYIAEWIYLFTALGTFGSFLQLTDLAPCMCFVTLAINAMVVILRRRKRIVKVITTLEEIFPADAEDQRVQYIPEKKRQFDRLLFTFSGAFLSLITTFNFIDFGVTLIGFFKSGVWKKDLPYFLWYPFDEYDDRYFPYIYLHQTWAGFTTVFAIMAEIFLIGALVLQFCIQFERISMSIKEYRPNRSTDTRFLREIIAQHNYILNNAQEFADIISGTLFILHTCSSLIICCAGFQVVVGQNPTSVIKFLLFLFCSLMQTIVVNYFGHQIMEYVR